MKPKTPLTSPFAIAACSYSLALPVASSNEIILQLTPAGAFTPADDREMAVPNWFIDSAIASRVIDKFNQRTQPVVIDYEHQTLWKEQNGQPAPAAAWMRELIWREGEGLFVRAELTPKARDAIANKEYLFISPVFRFNRDGHVTEMEMAAITNTPAVHGMRELDLLAAACFDYSNHTNPEESDMKLLAALITALSLTQDATEEQAIAALTARLQQDPLQPLRVVLGAKADAGEEDLVAACTALQGKQVDPAKFVPVSVVDSMKSELAVLTAKLDTRDQAEMETDVEAAITDGRLHKDMKQWAMDLGKSDRAALTAYLQKAVPNPALSGSQTGGKQPEANETGLTADELAICTNMGLTPEAFKKAKG